MQRRIGDRFKWSGDGWFIWEIVDHTDSKGLYLSKIVEVHNGLKDKNLYRLRVSQADEYLGNFAKSENFNNLYEKLSRS